ncbi:MAG: hypothetical protein PHI79_01245 [Sulfurovaceae bacterium]|nr:hypothetical protein [Sulfurovaceae bacterium]
MGREDFLKKIKEIDDDYIPCESVRETFMEAKTQMTAKEWLLLHWDTLLSNVDIIAIERSTLSNVKFINPFIDFYDLDSQCLKDIFYLLAKTHKALKYYNEYSSPNRDLKARNTSKNITKKINKIIELIMDTDIEVNDYIQRIEYGEQIDHNFIPKGYKTVEYLAYFKDTLENKHYTERQLFENLLFEMYHLLKDDFSKEQILRAVNLLIKKYFSRDISFTRKINLDNFVQIKYIYETMAGIDLTHSTRT